MSGLDPLSMIDARLTRIENKMDCLDRKVTDLRIASAKNGAMWGVIAAAVVTMIEKIL